MTEKENQDVSINQWSDEAYLLAPLGKAIRMIHNRLYGKGSRGGLNFEDFSKDTGIGYTKLFRIERGTSTPSRGELNLIKQAFLARAGSIPLIRELEALDGKYEDRLSRQHQNRVAGTKAHRETVKEAFPKILQKRQNDFKKNWKILIDSPNTHSGELLAALRNSLNVSQEKLTQYNNSLAVGQDSQLYLKQLEPGISTNTTKTLEISIQALQAYRDKLRLAYPDIVKYPSFLHFEQYRQQQQQYFIRQWENLLSFRKRGRSHTNNPIVNIGEVIKTIRMSGDIRTEELGGVMLPPLSASAIHRMEEKLRLPEEKLDQVIAAFKRIHAEYKSKYPSIYLPLLEKDALGKFHDYALPFCSDAPKQESAMHTGPCPVQQAMKREASELPEGEREPADNYKPGQIISAIRHYFPVVQPSIPARK